VSDQDAVKMGREGEMDNEKSIERRGGQSVSVKELGRGGEARIERCVCGGMVCVLWCVW
jgi:hypothetical protein